MEAVSFLRCEICCLPFDPKEAKLSEWAGLSHCDCRFHVKCLDLVQKDRNLDHGKCPICDHDEGPGKASDVEAQLTTSPAPTTPMPGDTAQTSEQADQGGSARTSEHAGDARSPEQAGTGGDARSSEQADQEHGTGGDARSPEQADREEDESTMDANEPAPEVSLEQTGLVTPEEVEPPSPSALLAAATLTEEDTATTLLGNLAEDSATLLEEAPTTARPKPLAPSPKAAGATLTEEDTATALLGNLAEGPATLLAENPTTAQPKPLVPSPKAAGASRKRKAPAEQATAPPKEAPAALPAAAPAPTEEEPLPNPGSTPLPIGPDGVEDTTLAVVADLAVLGVGISEEDKEELAMPMVVCCRCGKGFAQSDTKTNYRSMRKCKLCNCIDVVPPRKAY